MIHAVFQSKYGKFSYFSIHGHAGFADAGQDIVCAAVSSAVQLIANLITETFQESAEISSEHNKIQINLNFPDSGAGSSLLQALQMHLQYIAEEYPNTIQITIQNSGNH